MFDAFAAPTTPATPQQRYWKRNVRLTLALLAVWFVLTFGSVFWAAELNIRVLGWPFSFWMAGQGALLIYCAIVWCYAWAMDRLDEAYAAEASQKSLSSEASASG